MNIHTNERVAIKVENRSTKYPQLMEEYQVYRAVAKGVGVPAAIWCFGEDTRVLTDRGFMFLDEIERRIAGGDQLLYASYESASKQIVYGPGRLVFPPNKAGSLVSFTQTAEAARWGAESGPYGAVAHGHEQAADDQSNHLSLRVTPGHDMYVQVGDANSSDGADDGQKELLPPTKVKARELLKLGANQTVRFVAVAEQGAAGNDIALLAHLRAALGLCTPEQVGAFLALYGFWLGGGSVQCDGPDVGRVVFAQAKEDDLRWLQSQLTLCDLMEGRDFSIGSEGETTDAVVVRVMAPAWFRYFDQTYGRGRQSCDSSSNGSSYGLPPASVDADAIPADELTVLSAAEPLVAEQEEGVKSDQCLFFWALRWLSKDQCRVVVDGLRRADGTLKSGLKRIGTASVSLRDALVVLLLHAGYSAHFALDHAKGNDHWSVQYTDAQRECGPSKGAAMPTLASHEISQSEYAGREWCVQVDNPEHLIVAQRAERTGDIVTKASRPVVVGNCGSNSNVHIMVMELLGDSLETLYNQCGRKFSLKTITMLAIQLLHRIEHHHNHHYLHRVRHIDAQWRKGRMRRQRRRCDSADQLAHLSDLPLSVFLSVCSGHQA